MTFPVRLQDWTYERVRGLVEKGYLETETFDFKFTITGKDPHHASRLTASACAFANAQGGFLVFGIQEPRPSNAHAEIVGVDRDVDLAKHFSDQISGATPQIYFDFLAPITIPNSDKVLFVIHIPHSPLGPHMTREGLFYMRTNGGNRRMTYEEIRSGFLQYEQRMRKLKLLRLEVVQNLQIAREMNVPERKAHEVIPASSLSTRILEELLVDLYPILERDTPLVRDLMSARKLILEIENRTAFIFSIAGAAFQSSKRDAEDMTRAYNSFLRETLPSLVDTCQRVLNRLDQTFGIKNLEL